jgi:hypothetical protein
MVIINKMKKIFLAFALFTILSFSLVSSASYSGSLKLNKDSSGNVVISGGTSPIVWCGNGIFELSNNEQCDGQQLGGATCQSLGLALGQTWTGSLSCKSNCVYETSGCSVVQSSSGSDSSSGSSGSSGGRSKTISPTEVINPTKDSTRCIENWQCEEWSNLNGQCGKRKCTDSNECGSETLKPIISKECSSNNLFTGFAVGISDFVKTPAGIATFTIVGLFVVGGITFLAVKGKFKKLLPKKEENTTEQ